MELVNLLCDDEVTRFMSQWQDDSFRWVPGGRFSWQVEITAANVTA